MPLNPLYTLSLVLGRRILGLNVSLIYFGFLINFHFSFSVSCSQ